MFYFANILPPNSWCTMMPHVSRRRDDLTEQYHAVGCGTGAVVDGKLGGVAVPITTVNRRAVTLGYVESLAGLGDEPFDVWVSDYGQASS